MSNTPTSSAQVAEGMNLEAERAAPKLLTCPFCGDQAASVHEHPIATGSYMAMCSNCTAEGPLTNSKEQAADEWNRRTAAPVAEGVALPPLDAEGLPSLNDEYIYALWSQSYTDALKDAGTGIGNGDVAHMNHPIIFAHAVERQVEIRYAERIRQLERELATFKGEHATQLATKSIDTHEFRDLLWKFERQSWSVTAINNLIAYIDGRTAGPAVPQWRSIETAPQDKMLLLAAEFDGPGDWRIKVGGFWDRKWNVFGATWTPTSWMPLPAAPKPQEDA